MKDGVIKGTGNSRFLKSAITSKTTWEQFRASLLAGTVPIDLNGTNTDGWTQVGTALSKANLLSDATAAALEAALGADLPADPTPNDAFGALAFAPVKIVMDSYTGTGTYGSSNKTSITFDFTPKLLFISAQRYIRFASAYNQNVPFDAALLIWGVTEFVASTDGSTSSNCTNIVSYVDNTISWYNTKGADWQLNISGKDYHYVAIG